MSAPPKACVIGWPVEHSRSPLIHRYWLEVYGIAGSYEKIAVEPGALADELKVLIENGYRGCNVTLPHKEAALALADQADDQARAIGAANTLWFEGERVFASNTDAYGFITHLNASAPAWPQGDRPAAVLGAGGAARAVLKALIDAGQSEIRLLNRTRKRAEALARQLEGPIVVSDWDARDEGIAGCGLLVNTSTLGMAGAPALEIDLAAMGGQGTVADIVYVPLETPLLRQAKDLGHVAVDGLGMLLHQAVPGFEKWFGQRPQVDEGLRAKIVADLEGTPC